MTTTKTPFNRQSTIAKAMSEAQHVSSYLAAEYRTNGVADLSIVEKKLRGALMLVLDVIEYDSDGCKHEWQEQPGEPAQDVCSSCGAVRQ